MLSQGLTVTEIAARLGRSKATVCYHRRRLGHAVDARFARRHDWPAIQRFYDLGHSVRECQREFGFSRKTWQHAVRRGAVAPRPRALPLETLLVSGRPRSRVNIKQRLLAAGLKVHACEQCGISAWRGGPLSMSLHHVNGDRHDNRLENLVLLCPNCHSQTPNFGVRNRDFGVASGA